MSLEGLRRTKKNFRIIGVVIGTQTRNFLNTNEIQVAHVSIGRNSKDFSRVVMNKKLGDF